MFAGEVWEEYQVLLSDCFCLKILKSWSTLNKTLTSQWAIAKILPQSYHSLLRVHVNGCNLVALSSFLLFFFSGRGGREKLVTAVRDGVEETVLSEWWEEVMRSEVRLDFLCYFILAFIPNKISHFLWIISFRYLPHNPQSRTGQRVAWPWSGKPSSSPNSDRIPDKDSHMLCVFSAIIMRKQEIFFIFPNRTSLLFLNAKTKWNLILGGERFTFWKKAGHFKKNVVLLYTFKLFLTQKSPRSYFAI